MFSADYGEEVRHRLRRLGGQSYSGLHRYLAMEIAPAAAPSIDGDTAANDAASSVDAVQASSSSPDAAPRNEANLSTSFPGANYDDDEEEEDVCRICRNPRDADNPLSYPCACSGSIKFVHQDCLLQWLNHSNARQCEVHFFFPMDISCLILQRQCFLGELVPSDCLCGETFGISCLGSDIGDGSGK